MRGGGNELIAAEFLRGAFAHCLITFAQNEGLPHDSHRAFRHIASWTLRILSGISEGICNTMVQSGGEFLYIGVGGR